jgi:endonuclease/exonuclease/phosphatase family metal-dependent hydrolase
MISRTQFFATLFFAIGGSLGVVGCGSAGPKDYVPRTEAFSLTGAAPVVEAVSAATRPAHTTTMPTSTGATVTVATFNLSELKNPALLAEDIGLMPPVDIWIFQEVALPEPGQPIEPAIDKLKSVLPSGDWNAIAIRMNPADNNKKDKGWEGQAIVSRFPIGEPQQWRLEASGPKRRRALVAPVETPIGTIQVVNTDHEASFLDPSYGNQKQVAGLVSQLQRSKAPLAVVGGDFNSAGNAFRFRTSTADVQKIDSSMATAKFEPLPNRPEAEAAPTYKFMFANVQLDHLYSRGLECVEWDSPVVNGSSHRAVWAKYRVKE